MKKALFQMLLFLLAIPVLSQHAEISGEGVTIITDEANRKADVYIHGRYFTSYIYPASLVKPVLFPITTATGTLITRGFPLDPRPGERVDHPHQVGFWFTYGAVNGLDFWGNSYAIPDSLKSHYGRIVHQAILKAEGGMDEGMLVVVCQWVDNNNTVLLNEETTFRFSGSLKERFIIRTTKLTALQEVKFEDSKEGLCALRVDRAFESPSDQPEIYTDASGRPTSVPVLNNTGVNGIYRSSEGKEKDAVWGARAGWVSLSAAKEGEDISIAMFDHPKNPGFPAYWHARGYGLFSVNNLGQKAYKASEPEKVTLLKKGETLVFNHMLWIKSGGIASIQEMNSAMDFFSRFQQ